MKTKKLDDRDEIIESLLKYLCVETRVMDKIFSEFNINDDLIMYYYQELFGDDKDTTDHQMTLLEPYFKLHEESCPHHG